MKRIFALSIYFFIATTHSAVFSPAEIKTLRQNFIVNIMDTGAVIASPSRYYPDYYYDWTRDAAITMDLVETWYEKEKKPEDKARLFNYVHWVEQAQHQVDTLPGQDILGEPKFYLDGRAFDGPWGRPQNDGPALRALTLIRFAHALIKNKEMDYVRTHLYNGGLNPKTMGAIKMDLEYIAHHWQEKNYDLWEEVYGDHFFTAMVQRKALLEGAKLARELKEETTAAFYESKARLIEERLLKHIDKENLIIQASLAPHPGPQKTYELDSAVMLAVLLGHTDDNPFLPDNFYVKNTVAALKDQFKMLYPINDNHTDALLFGRYPGDTYDGYRNDGLGNPWFILTATIAEYHYKLATMLPNDEEHRSLIEANRNQGDNYLKLIKHYAPNLLMSEQINLNTGIQQGAISLTWSYVAVLRAIDLREKIKLH
ncbi:glycoside hydrolase family 15 protein [Legionella hackeliae]|uniref:glucan 1,4-alpha-glucosidase n=1 Tax=Legionella hackeliae TaxID=449 RepID=A0A0A8UUV0_LEGHA|nr:glycoside hydrolase family 15 protein [Legionella hackeliae]KTD13863.1 glucoamylase [Legionella hackeliae]CEK10564.1 Glucoamylase [Legionella hackeliae]STX47304.1 glucoamylase [Legionella hackeliae]